MPDVPQRLEDPISFESIDFGKLEQVAGVKLSAAQRAEIYGALTFYQVMQGFLLSLEKGKAARRRLEKKIKSLRSFLGALGDGGRIDEHVLEYQQVSVEKLKSMLKNALHRYEEMRDFYRSPGGDSDEFIPGLLKELARCFVDANGGRTGVDRDKGEREGRSSRFVDFAEAAMSHLPEALRPSSNAALAARWERIHAHSARWNGSRRYARNDRIVPNVFLSHGENEMPRERWWTNATPRK